MSHDSNASHPSPTQDYNPERDYQRFMQWTKYGVIACIVIVIVMRFAIG